MQQLTKQQEVVALAAAYRGPKRADPRFCAIMRTVDNDDLMSYFGLACTQLGLTDGQLHGIAYGWDMTTGDNKSPSWATDVDPAWIPVGEAAARACGFGPVPPPPSEAAS